MVWWEAVYSGGWPCCGSFGGWCLVVCLMAVSLKELSGKGQPTHCFPGHLELDGRRGRRRSPGPSAGRGLE